MKRILWVLLALAAGLLSGCPAGDSGGGSDEGERGTEVTLPDACYGEWEVAGSSGGIAGDGDPGVAASKIRMVLTRDHVMETRRPDGSVTKRTFAIREGDTIFSSEPGFLLTLENSSMDLAVSVTPDGSGLSLSENVYDGFSTSYRRVE